MKTFRRILALALVLSLGLAAVPARAADAADSAMRAYAEIVAHPGAYDFGVDSYVEIDRSAYTYALLDLADGGGVPTLLLSLSIDSPWLGSMEY